MDIPTFGNGVTPLTLIDDAKRLAYDEAQGAIIDLLPKPTDNRKVTKLLFGASLYDVFKVYHYRLGDRVTVCCYMALSDETDKTHINKASYVLKNTT